MVYEEGTEVIVMLNTVNEPGMVGHAVHSHVTSDAQIFTRLLQ